MVVIEVKFIGRTTRSLECGDCEMELVSFKQPSLFAMLKGASVVSLSKRPLLPNSHILVTTVRLARPFGHCELDGYYLCLTKYNNKTRRPLKSRHGLR